MNVHQIISLAESHVSTWHFWKIREVKWRADGMSGGLWYPEPETRTARIECAWEENVDLVFHEAFHSVWRESPMAEKDPYWCEGFCNAFSGAWRWVKTKDKISPSEFRRAQKDEWTRLYDIPDRLISKEHGGVKGGIEFRQFWLRLNLFADHEKKGFFSRHMGYSPETGKRI